MTTASWRCGSFLARRREESEAVDPCSRQRFHCKTSSAIRSSRGYSKETTRSSCSITLTSRTSDSALMMVYMQEREVLAGLFFKWQQLLPNAPKTSNLTTKNKIKLTSLRLPALSCRTPLNSCRVQLSFDSSQQRLRGWRGNKKPSKWQQAEQRCRFAPIHLAWI